MGKKYKLPGKKRKKRREDKPDRAERREDRIARRHARKEQNGRVTLKERQVMLQQIALEVYREGDTKADISSKVRGVLQKNFGEGEYGDFKTLGILLQIFIALLPIILKLLLL